MALNSPGFGSVRPPVPAAPQQSRSAAAFGVAEETEAQRQARTGVDPGGTGYVSGQVDPRAFTAPAAAPAAPAPPATPGVQAAATGAPMMARGANQVDSGSPLLARGARGPAPGVVPGTVPADDITTRTSAITSAGPGQNSPQPTGSGTTEGSSPIPTGSSASPTVYIGDKLGIDVPDPGGDLLKPTLADLAPTQQAQAKAFGASDDFSQERFDYRPGSAPTQDRVALDTANADQLRARQFGSLDDLAAAARGEVPSAAELQLRQQAAKNNAATFGAARALGGRSAGGAGRAATLASTDANIRTNADAGMMRATEQANARNQLISALSGVRGQDIDISQANANLNQAANANNLQSQTQANALAEQHRQALIEAQLAAMGIGTNAASATVGASRANADSVNKSKDSVKNAISSFFSV
jgi:hypothetical protein